MANKATPEAIAYIVDNYGHITAADIAAKIGMSCAMVYHRAGKLGLRSQLSGEKNKWREQDDEYIHEHYASTPTAVIAARLGRTIGAVRTRANAIGANKEFHRWRLREIDYIRNNINDMPIRAIARHLNLPPTKIHHAIQRFGILSPRSKKAKK